MLRSRSGQTRSCSWTSTFRYWARRRLDSTNMSARSERSTRGCRPFCSGANAGKCWKSFLRGHPYSRPSCFGGGTRRKLGTICDGRLVAWVVSRSRIREGRSMLPHVSHPLKCRCGALQGAVARPDRANRGVCYCRSCQAYAHFLGAPGDVLDQLRGTDVVATCPRFVTLTKGRQNLVCMSLSPNGPLRWYASCCNTPIGNTP